MLRPLRRPAGPTPEPGRPAGGNTGRRRPRAVIHRSRDRAGRRCADTIADVLRSSDRRFDVVFAGPAGSHDLSADLLATAALYVQPGGGALESAYRRLRSRRTDIRAYVGAGGRYLGLCLGGYLAGATPGFGLLPGDTDRYIDLSGADAPDDRDAVVPVIWRGVERLVHFQDGPHFVLDPGAPGAKGVEVVARYRNGAIAALVAPYGAGRVAVCGPHPEAGPDWAEDLPAGTPAPAATDLIEDLLGSLLGNGPDRSARPGPPSGPGGQGARNAPAW